MNEELQGSTDNKIIHKKHLKTTGKETTENNLEQSHKQRSHTTAANLGGEWMKKEQFSKAEERKQYDASLITFSQFSLD